MKNDPVQKVVNYKDHASGNYKVSLPHIPVIVSIDHCTAVPCAVQIGAGYSTLLITALCLVNSARGIQLRRAWQCCSQKSPREIFHLQLFSLRHFS